jgi:osomolarity two-component system response regulator SSK1
MLHRKIWVKRPNASATLVQIREDDLVDDVREMILRKYANSLGKAFDSPDLTLRIHPRDDDSSKTADRTLGPEEEMCRTLDAYYPGGQTVTDALIIDVPQRKTPRPSPRVPVYYPHHDDTRPYDTASEYFPQMPIVNPSPAALTAASHDSRVGLPHPHSHSTHSIAVLQTGQLPPLPSPGGTSRRPHHSRPKYPRHNTASPTALTGGAPNAPGPQRQTQQRQRHDSTSSDAKQSSSSHNAPIPTPPAPTDNIIRHESNPPTPRVSSPRPDKKRKKQKNGMDAPSLPAGLLDNSVPPINVLIVEDNIINLRVLGAFMQRLKVRWQRAMNGKEAVTKWRAGGFHLVLMDIQLPIMNGLEATKEIRRLERVNSIGVFSSGSSEAPNQRLGENGQKDGNLNEDDKLGDKSLFKSPVIIVALTASSLQSDRHEALAAGCNDFLTKVYIPPRVAIPS